MPLGRTYDDQIVKLLALTPMTATRLGSELKIDKGSLTIHLFNKVRKEGLIKVVDADGSSPVWALTAEGQKHRERLGYP